MRELSRDIGIPGQPLQARVWERTPAVSTLLIFMPAAVELGNPHRHPSFARWRWADSFPTSHVVAFSDPSMGLSESLRGAWYMHSDIDVIAAMASIVNEFSSTVGVSRTLVYGSSLGGFGALALASLVPGARAVAEVPQLDFANWFPGAVADVEKYILHRPIALHRERHPQQVSVTDRFLSAERIPPYTIITNVQDRGFDEQVAFHRWASDPTENLRRDGHRELRVLDHVLGHKVLGAGAAQSLIREQLGNSGAA